MRWTRNSHPRVAVTTSRALVTAAVDAAGVARLAERELFSSSEKKRATAVRQLATANRQGQEAIKLVLAARGIAESAVKRADEHQAAQGPRLFDGSAG